MDGIGEHAVVRLRVAMNLQVGGAILRRKPQAVPAEGDGTRIPRYDSDRFHGCIRAVAGCRSRGRQNALTKRACRECQQDKGEKKHFWGFHRR